MMPGFLMMMLGRPEAMGESDSARRTVAEPGPLRALAGNLV